MNNAKFNEHLKVMDICSLFCISIVHCNEQFKMKFIKKKKKPNQFTSKT